MTTDRKKKLKEKLENAGSIPLLPAIWMIVQVLQEVIDELP